LTGRRGRGRLQLPAAAFSKEKRCFLKKEAKNFARLSRTNWQKFFGSFFQKRTLTFLLAAASPLPHPATHSIILSCAAGCGQGLALACC